MSVAASLLADRRARRIVARPDPAPKDAAEAAAIQRALATLAGTETPAGFKIGATGARMQANLGLSSPIAGFVAAADLHASGVTLPFAALLHPGIECELAVRLARDLPPGPITIEEAAAAVGEVMAAIEIVENRYGPDLAAFGAFGLCADQMFHAAAVAGAPGTVPPADLRTLSGRLLVNGVERDHGVGADLLGDPLACLAWLASSAEARAFGGLRAGQIVLLGSVTPPLWLPASPDLPIDVTVAFDRLPPVFLRVS